MGQRLGDFLENESDDEDKDDPIENARRRRLRIRVRFERDVDDEKNDEEEIGDSVGNVGNARLPFLPPSAGETLVAASNTGKAEYVNEGNK